MADFTRAQVQHLARLAKLDLTAEEIELYQKELAVILEFIDQLQAVEVGDLPPTEQVTDLRNVSRPDQSRDGLVLNREQLEANELEFADRQIKIPKVNL